MAENQENRSGEDLTEEASPYRLEEYRRKGMVAQSREVTSLAALLAAGVTAYIMSPQIGAQISEFMREVFRTDLSSRLDLSNGGTLRLYLMKSLSLAASVGLPICIAGFICGALASFAQIGSIFTFEPLTPDASKINPLSGLQRLFSKKHLVESTRLIVKMSIVLLVTYGLLKTEILNSPAYMGSETSTLFTGLAHSSKVIFTTLVLIFGVFAGVDFFLTRFDYNKKLRMTKQEAKQEHKEREGDPQIKARIRAVQREVARRRMMQAVKKATVVITNPTHFAIAIVYEKDMFAPKVVAKGADFMAQKIKKIAAEAGVPMVENVPLARTLYKTVKINQQIPRALYQAVAEVLAYVFKLKGKNGV